MKNTQTASKKEELTSIRIDKFLKISRIIKRRSVAKDFCDSDRVWVNGRDAKASSKIKVGDTVKIKFGNNMLTFKVNEIRLTTKKEGTREMYDIIEEVKGDE